MADRRLMAMLDELERGLRRAEAVERIVCVSLGQPPISPRPIERVMSLGPSSGQTAIRTLDRTMAAIVFFWIVSIVWSLALNQTPLSQAPVAEFKQPQAPFETGQGQSAPALKDATPPAAHGDGLSVEQFETQVRRILAEKRKRSETAAVEGEGGASYPDETTYAFPLAKDDPLPEPVAPLKAEPEKAAGAEGQIVESLKPQTPKIAKAKAPEKTKKTKQPSKPAAAPARAAPAPSGPLALVMVATANITNFVRKWLPK